MDRLQLDYDQQIASVLVFAAAAAAAAAAATAATDCQRKWMDVERWHVNLIDELLDASGIYK